MFSRRFLDSLLDSGMFVIGGALLVVLVGAIVALAPIAIDRWF